MDALAISLGHNSSAVAIRNGAIIGGYEEERFTGKKSDSSFPINAISKLKRLCSLSSNTKLCVSHWFPDGAIQHETKYWSRSTMRDLFPDGEVLSLAGGDLTHHDAHMESARVFAGDDFADRYHVFVIDGFGTFGEHVTVYEVCKSYTRKVIQMYGYEYSIGLFYQYATDYCGMKMHNHEYKMLAFETHILDVVSKSELGFIDSFIAAFSKSMFTQALYEGKKVSSLDTLPAAKTKIQQHISKFIELFCKNSDHVTVLVSYFAQRHTENMLAHLMNVIQPENLLVVGGVFYNVKLNHLLANSVPGKFCAMPLAGDQGAGLGVYQHYFGDLQWPDHLFWGHRNIRNHSKFNQLRSTYGINVVESSDCVLDLAFLKMCDALDQNGFVNIVRGSMEYGPRALCNTSTIALPNKRVGAVINYMNDRTNEMPFALAVTEAQSRAMFYETEKVHKSLEYMIMARSFRTNEMALDVDGGAHYYPLTDSYTCRPQVTSDPLMVKLLNHYGPLINTSWNYHGMPIVRSVDDILYTHGKERERCPETTTMVEVWGGAK